MTTPLDSIPSWMLKDGTPDSKTEIVKTDRGWEKVWPNGQSELLQAVGRLGGLAEAPGVIPSISNIISPDAGDYSKLAGDDLVWLVHFDEAVSGALPTATVDLGGTAPAAAVVAQVDDNTLSLSVDANDGVGANVPLGAVAVAAIALAGGALVDTSANPADLTTTGKFEAAPEGVEVVA